MYFELGRRPVRRAASRCRVELIEVVMRILGVGGGCSSALAKRVGEFGCQSSRCKGEVG